MPVTQIQKQNLFSRRDRYKYHPRGKIMFAREVMNLQPNPDQCEALVLAQTKLRVAIKSGHGIGKTVFDVICMYSHLFCYYNALVGCTAPSLHQLNDQLWREAYKWLNKSVPDLQNFLKWTPTKIYVNGYKGSWYAVAIPSSNPHTFQGLHHKYLLLILDEAPGIKESAFEVIDGALTEPENKLIMIGNPTRVGGYYYDTFQDPGEDWGLATFNSERSCQIDKKYPLRMAKRYGKNSNVYRVRVLGQFPTGEDDSIFDIDIINEAMKRTEPLEEEFAKEGGCDVARYGPDKSQIYARHGLEIVGHKEIAFGDLASLQAEILHFIRKYKLTKFKIDQTGMGGGVVDNLIDIIDNDNDIACNIIGVDNNQNAIEHEEFDSAGAEMYWWLREVLKNADMPNDKELKSDLIMRKYHFSRQGKIAINSKEDLRREQKRRGDKMHSPDKGDGYALCYYNMDDINDYIAQSREAY